MIMTTMMTAVLMIRMVVRTMTMTMMIQYLPRCDCDSLAADPDSFCSNGEVCKVIITMIMFMVLITVMMLIMVNWS